MKKLLLLGLVATSVSIVILMSSCSHYLTNSTTIEMDVTSETTTNEPSLRTPTSIPTYAPGTEIYGMLSVTGEVVIEPKYEYLDIFSEEGLARFCDHGLWGFVNNNGEEVIPAQYEDANNFSEGLAAVKVDGLWGFIDESGEMVIEPQFEGIPDRFKNGLCVFRTGNLQGLINKQGKTVLGSTYDLIDLYAREYFIVRNDNGAEQKCGVIDRDGKLVVELQSDEIYAVTDSGFYFTRKGPDDEYDIVRDLFERYPQQYTADYQSEYFRYPMHVNVLIKVSLDGEKWGLLNPEDGTLTVDYMFDYISYFPEKQYAEVYCDSQTGTLDLVTKKLTLYGDADWTFSEIFGVICFEEQGKYGVNKIDGTEVLPAVYEQIICTPHNEYAVLEEGALNFKVIDGQSNTLFIFENGIVPIRYIPSIKCWECFFLPYSETEAVLDSDGFISRDGTIKVELKCYEYQASPFWFGEDENPMTTPAIYSVVLPDGNGGFGVLNPLVESAPVLYEDYSWFPDQKVLVVTDRVGNCGLVSYDGTVLFELQDCQIFTNTGLMITGNDSYIYEQYNDTDYLIYTVKAR